MIKSVLIANRGEIACRIARTARALGIRTVAVYSATDHASPHVQAADEAIYIGESAVQSSYLHGDKIIQAAKQTHVEAIHPGYGFLSENSDFAHQCETENLIFIGPGSDAIALMGNKRAAKLAVMAADVPCIPGYQETDQSDAALKKATQSIGYPLMLKATAGGGGKGMRIVRDEQEWADALVSARSEALNAFGNDELIIEKYIDHPRHIEIQIFADQQGNVIHLGERECSIQRRHQKVIEESPSPAINEKLRALMGAAAINAAKVCHYVGAGTVEFILDGNEQFYFLEMNTRLQVEHPVTEFITGIDLVEWQFLVASGKPLPCQQKDIQLNGHAIEARLYAEDPYHDFLPQTGVITHLALPAHLSSNDRVDHAIAKGLDISPYYDPMLGKWIAWGQNRQQAIQNLRRLLSETVIHGLNHNRAFLSAILQDPAFIEGHFTTHFIANSPYLHKEQPAIKAKHLIFSAMRMCLENDVSAFTSQPRKITSQPGLFQRSSALSRKLLFNFTVNNTHYKLTGTCTQQPMTMVWTIELITPRHEAALTPLSADSKTIEQTEDFTVQLIGLEDQSQKLTLIINDIQSTETITLNASSAYIDCKDGHLMINDVTFPEIIVDSSSPVSGMITAPMDGKIVAVNVEAGQNVTEGDTLLIMEAMKMEHPIKAPYSGKVEAVTVRSQEQAKRSQSLLILESI